MQRSVEQAERYAQIYAARDAEIRLLIAEAEETEEQVIPDARREAIIVALDSYDGPLTRNGLPNRRALNEHAGFKIEGWEKRALWSEV